MQKKVLLYKIKYGNIQLPLRKRGGRMPNFKYVALTPQGKEIKGTIEANDVEDATAKIKTEGNIPVKVSEETFLDKDLSIGKKGGKVKSRDFSIFCRQFVSIVGAGVTIVNALDMLADSTQNKTLKAAIQNVSASVNKGETLAGAMRKETCFPPLLNNMVEAGESSGSLEVAFDRMGTQFEKETRTASMIKKACIYPIAIIVVLIAVIIIMLAFVIPVFADMFADAGAKLPWITQLLLDMSNFVKTKWYILILAVIVLVVAFKVFASTQFGKYFLADAMIKLPIFGNLTVKGASSSFCRTMSTLLAAGVPVIEALDITAKTMSNLRFQDAVYMIREQVAQGRQMSEPIEECGLFPPTVIHMCRIGEETGNIEHMLTTAADYFDEEVEAATEQVAAVIEPCIIVVMAVIVGGVIMAIMMPMMSMYDMAGGGEV